MHGSRRSWDWLQERADGSEIPIAASRPLTILTTEFHENKAQLSLRFFRKPSNYFRVWGALACFAM